jgi:hypothetical protein
LPVSPLLLLLVSTRSAQVCPLHPSLLVLLAARVLVLLLLLLLLLGLVQKPTELLRLVMSQQGAVSKPQWWFSGHEGLWKPWQGFTPVVAAAADRATKPAATTCCCCCCC